MRAVSHVIGGCLVAASVANPILALPLAFVSHFVLDVFPHYGEAGEQRRAYAQLKYDLPVDALLALAVLGAVWRAHPANVYTILLGGVLAASPDLWQIPRYVRYLKTGNTKPLGDWFSQFHAKIQWCERGWGILVELPLSVGMLFLLFSIL